jgi:uncharacterized protein (DUF2336 family)
MDERRWQVKQPFISEAKIRRLLRTAGEVQARLLERALAKIEDRRCWKRQRKGGA